jgi:hypothetical protein
MQLSSWDDANGISSERNPNRLINCSTPCVHFHHPIPIYYRSAPPRRFQVGILNKLIGKVPSIPEIKYEIIKKVSVLSTSDSG